MSFLKIEDPKESKVKGEPINAVQNPEENTPEIVSTANAITAAIYQDKTSSGSAVANVFSIDGALFETIYFSQYLKADDYPRQLDTNLHASLQQYVRIENFNLYLQGDIERTKDNQTGISIVTGRARTYPGITIQPGDMFVGSIEGPIMGLFVVGNDITPLTWRSSSTAYEFDFKLFDYAEEHYLNELDTKTIDNYVFDETGATCGNGLIKASQVKASVEAPQLITELVDVYYDKFYSKEVGSFSAAPDELVYDPAVTEFMVRMISKKYLGRHSAAIRYIAESREYRDRVETIWDVLMSGARAWSSRVNRTFEKRSTEEYKSPYTFNHLNHSQYNSVIAPARKASITSAGTQDDSENFYVFSEGFYDNDRLRVNKFESVLLGAISGVMPSLEKVEELVEETFQKEYEKQFYEIPVLIWYLLKILG